MAKSDNPAEAVVQMGEDAATRLQSAANAYSGAFGASFKAAQDYQTKLMQVFQANAEANMQLAQKLMQTRTPSDFVEAVSSHMRERASALGEQAKELATLAQEASRKAIESIATPPKS